MWHTVLPIYGPIAIHGYGMMIAIGLLVFLYLLQKDYRFHQLRLAPHLPNILMVGIIAGVLGGRILFFIIHPELYENILGFFAFFYGGLSILGCIIALLCTLPVYLRYLRIPIMPFLDLIALYAPLLQSISRIGCFLSGCCYGLPTSVAWGITYTAPDTVAPLYIRLHPTQLYSAGALLIIFIFMYFVGQHVFRYTGQLTYLYLFLIGIERFTVEFWRGDYPIQILFSLNHYIAASMIIFGLIGLIITTKHKT